MAVRGDRTIPAPVPVSHAAILVENDALDGFEMRFSIDATPAFAPRTPSPLAALGLVINHIFSPVILENVVEPPKGARTKGVASLDRVDSN